MRLNHHVAALLLSTVLISHTAVVATDRATAELRSPKRNVLDLSFDTTDPEAWKAVISEGLRSFAETAKDRQAAVGTVFVAGGGNGGRRRRAAERIPTSPDQLRGCGEVINTHSKDDIVEIANSVLDATLPAQFLAIAKPAVEQVIQFDVRSRKICTSCEDMLAEFGDELTDATGENGFMSYCGPEISGHSSRISGLLLEPVNVTTRLVPVGKVKGSVWTKGTETNRFRAPSERWPVDIKDVVGDSKDPAETTMSLFVYIDLIAPLIAATAGIYTIVPDEQGHGEDYNGLVGYLNKRSYQTSAVPLWLYTKKLAKETTNGCTTMSDVATLGGYSIGGYSAVAVAASLHSLNVSITSVSAGGGPYKTASTVPMSTVESVDSGNFPLNAGHLIALAGYGYSSTDPHLPNTNTGQDLLSDDYMNNENYNMSVIRWIEDGLPAAQIIAKMPQNQLDILDQATVSFFRTSYENNITDPCVTEVQEGVNDKLCAALLENDLTEILENTPYKVDLCHSADDEVVSIENLPNISKNSLLKRFAFPQPPTGTHFEAALACVLGSLLQFTQFLGSPDQVSSVEPPDDENCYLPGANTVKPTAPPTASPTPMTTSSANSVSGGFAIMATLLVLLLSSRAEKW